MPERCWDDSLRAKGTLGYQSCAREPGLEPHVRNLLKLDRLGCPPPGLAMYQLFSTPKPVLRRLLRELDPPLQHKVDDAEAAKLAATKDAVEVRAAGCLAYQTGCMAGAPLLGWPALCSLMPRVCAVGCSVFATVAGMELTPSEAIAQFVLVHAEALPWCSRGTTPSSQESLLGVCMMPGQPSMRIFTAA